MSEWVIACYFGFGVALVQGMHTWHAANTYGQKQIRVLECPFLFRNYSGRRDPETAQMESLVRPFGRPYRSPWKLPHYQMAPIESTRIYRALGLHATNLYYAYAMAICYGVLAAFVMRLLVVQDSFTLRFVGAFVAVVASLLVVSHYVVGSGFEIVTHESNVAFNSLMLIALSNSIVGYDTAVTALQLVAALVAAPLAFWLTFQYREGNLGYDNFAPAYFIIVPILYAEGFVLTVGLVYG